MSNIIKEKLVIVKKKLYSIQREITQLTSLSIMLYYTLCWELFQLYTPNEGLSLANQNRGKLGVFGPELGKKDVHVSSTDKKIFVLQDEQ